MKCPKNILGQVHGFVKQSPVFSSFPMSLLLTGLEELMEKFFFACPCKDEQNFKLTVSLFTGPALFIFALMYLVLRPFKHECSCCSKGANDDTQQKCPKAFASCLIPPVMWIFFLLLDGDYIACAKTNWKGVYVFDQELNRSWCKPIEGFQDEKELRHLVLTYVLESQYYSYIMIGFFSALVITSVAIYDCCSGKCDLCQRLSCCLSVCGPTAETENEGQDPATVGQEPQGSESPATTRPQESGSSVTMGQEQKGSDKMEKPRSSSTTGHGLQGPGKFPTAGYGHQASWSSSTKGSTEFQNLIPPGKQIQLRTFKQ